MTRRQTITYLMLVAGFGVAEPSLSHVSRIFTEREGVMGNQASVGSPVAFRASDLLLHPVFHWIPLPLIVEAIFCARKARMVVGACGGHRSIFSMIVL